MAKPRRIFKLSYRIDLEYFQESTPNSGRVKTDLKASIRKTGDTRNITAETFLGERIGGQIDYLDKHLPTEIESMLTWLYTVEAAFYLWGDMRKFADTRNLIVSKHKKDFERRLRERLKTVAGRLSGQKEKEVSDEDSRAFIEWAVPTLQFLQLNNVKRNRIKTAFADEYYRQAEDRPQGRSNPIRDIDNVCRKHRTSFEELLNLTHPKLNKVTP